MVAVPIMSDNLIRTAGRLVYPDVVSNMERFLDLAYLGERESYSYLWPVTYGSTTNQITGAHYSQSNGLGIARPQLTWGNVNWYGYNLSKGFSRRAFQSKLVRGNVEEAIHSIGIEQWFAQNPSVDSQFFITSINKALQFAGQEPIAGVSNLGLSLGGCTFYADIILIAERQASGIYLRSFWWDAMIRDLYDFAEQPPTDPAKCGGRVEAQYDPLAGRTTGGIFYNALTYNQEFEYICEQVPIGSLRGLWQYQYENDPNCNSSN